MQVGRKGGRLEGQRNELLAAFIRLTPASKPDHSERPLKQLLTGQKSYSTLYSFRSVSKFFRASG